MENRRSEVMELAESVSKEDIVDELIRMGSEWGCPRNFAGDGDEKFVPDVCPFVQFPEDDAERAAQYEREEDYCGSGAGQGYCWAKIILLSIKVRAAARHAPMETSSMRVKSVTTMGNFDCAGETEVILEGSQRGIYELVGKPVVLVAASDFVPTTRREILERAYRIPEFLRFWLSIGRPYDCGDVSLCKMWSRFDAFVEVLGMTPAAEDVEASIAHELALLMNEERSMYGDHEQ